MSKVWRVVMVVVLIAILAGAVCVGVGMMTGGSWDHIYSVLDDRYHVDVYWKYVSVDLVGYFRELWSALTMPIA